MLESRLLPAAVLVAATFTWALPGTKSNAAGIFTLTSTTFEDGKIMPMRVANSKANQPNNPNCVGDNVSPQFSWSNAPNGTKSFVLLMSDPEGRAPSGVSHWVAYGIPASVTGLAEGEASKASDNYVGGKSTMGVGNYSGPCTPPGTSPHHYRGPRIIATDRQAPRIYPRMIRLCSRFDSVLFTPKMSAIPSYGNYSRSPTLLFLSPQTSTRRSYHPA
jgi:Raf kinase inhibitor-like YbhB/YbcL family protein